MREYVKIYCCGERLIDADALKKAMDGYWGRCQRIRKPRNGETAVFLDIKAIVETQPTVDAEPVQHGKWKWLSCTYDRVPKEKEYECSECHHKTIVHGDDMPWEKYCPNCGARMDEE